MNIDGCVLLPCFAVDINVLFDICNEILKSTAILRWNVFETAVLIISAFLSTNIIIIPVYVPFSNFAPQFMSLGLVVVIAKIRFYCSENNISKKTIPLVSVTL
jgi:hypothetical protein